MDWTAGINTVLEFIEANLSESITCADMAKSAYLSAGHFQRGFAMMTGMTAGEYLRNRRLSLAGEELSANGGSVLEVALKYGYESPESFSKAFTRFHGVTPAQAKKAGTGLRTFPPMKIKIILEGGTVMDYRIEKKDAFTVLALEKRFSYDNAKTEVPAFWAEFCKKAMNKVLCGMFGICIDDDEEGKTFTYLIADLCDKNAEVPDGYVKREIPAFTWAIFPTTGAMPDAIQKTNRAVYTEWLPGSEKYELAAGYNAEMYTKGNTQSPDYRSELWIPVKEK